MLRSLAFTLAALCGLSVPAAALPFVYQETFDPTDVFLSDTSSVACIGTNGADDTATPAGTVVAPCGTLSFSHLLTGFDSGDILQTATLTIYVRDDGGPADGSEKFSVTGDGSVLWLNQEPGGSGNSVAYGPLSVFAQLMSDSVLNIIVTAMNGDLFFERSVLDATWTQSLSEDVIPTPEPASLLLFGIGALVVGQRIRQARRR